MAVKRKAVHRKAGAGTRAPRNAGANRPARGKARTNAPVPARILHKLRAICLRLPGAYEEAAWVGIRWMVRKRNFAHVLRIDAGWPPAYARAASNAGPLLVLTFRTTDMLRDALRQAGERFFVAAWGTRWGTKVVGVKLRADSDWDEIETLLQESHRLLAPRTRAE